MNYIPELDTEIYNLEKGERFIHSIHYRRLMSQYNPTCLAVLGLEHIIGNPES